MTATDQVERDGYVVATRPTPGEPRPYDFPPIARAQLDNGLTVLVADLPGRPLISASIILPVGAVDEPAAEGGAATLAARALTEGTERYDAVGLTEASERLGASLHAEAGWDATSIGVDVPTTRLGPALELLASMAADPDIQREINEIEQEFGDAAGRGVKSLSP
jgi:predicted Zn-dependent peptidase